MKKFLLPLTLILTTSTVFAANAQVNNVQQLGSGSPNVCAVYPNNSDAVNYIMLSAFTDGSVANSFWPLIKASVDTAGVGTNYGAAYQVTAGKALYCPCTWLSTAGTGNGRYQFGYGDNAADRTATLPTNVKYENGVTKYWSIATDALTATTPGYVLFSAPRSFAAGKFPFVQTSGDQSITSIKMLCREY